MQRRRPAALVHDHDGGREGGRREGEGGRERGEGGRERGGRERGGRERGREGEREGERGSGGMKQNIDTHQHIHNMYTCVF